jgi:hypothetical protein
MPHPLAPLRDAGPYLSFVNCLPSGLLRAHGAPVAIHRAAKLTKTSSDATQLPSRNFLEGPSRVPVGQCMGRVAVPGVCLRNVQLEDCHVITEQNVI